MSAVARDIRHEPNAPAGQGAAVNLASATDWCVDIEEIRDPEAIAERWRDLERRAQCSFFQSWGWVGSWLKTFPEKGRPLLLQARFRGRIVGLSVLGRNALRHLKLLSSRALLVSETGIPADDALTVEHSGLLMEQGLEQEIIGHCLTALAAARIEWDELYISGVERGHIAAYLDGARAARLQPVVRADHPYFFVDLSELARTRTDYLSTLSRNSRYQVRRALREYRRRGDVRFEVAGSLPDALRFFAEMRTLHQAYWNGKGYPGAFATRSANDFHERLISGRFEKGEIQLVSVRVGNRACGYLYSFVFGGIVSNYQSGFRYEEDPKIKPGFVAHALAVEHNLEIGNRVYDFLVGDQRFKRSLATNEERMIWLALRKDRWKFRLENGLRALLGRELESVHDAGR